MMVDVYNPSICGAEAGRWNLKASLGYVVIHCLWKNNRKEAT